ncbi:sexual development activator [Colletotrichum truncatum]|uniref:Sexual development activator n=1 Tax=Colletotrichum truncatum TaxID=5467 RepID=A0ACC3Z9F7_COLTU|nr:sexual development activator [Colletotrichum truncatum]KAF6793591.1 sexual development activator [Colletotrichum truncatum]
MAFEPRPPTSIEEVTETHSFHERRTRGGPFFFYELTVLQQPERARACGSGQKSAADRRPVDPPPVVQLKVKKGMSKEEAKDVTMAYNGNFFLFAELAPARPMAHGRVQTPAATTTPVLTGMPVSGMAYLDRPSEAGYFLFPDLSVRHEGRYVLAFHLYEEIKNVEDRDHDSDPADDENPCFHYRMAVKSIPFSVFSAKKFPGLTESTHLSKTISEQGCRVRIRRDVRMRRREGKPSGNEFENTPESSEYNRNSRRTQTPELRSNAEQYRARSASNSSEHRAAYPPAPERRPSAVESFQPPPPPPPPHAAGAAPSNAYLRFGADTSSAPYPPHQQHPPPMAQPPPISPTASYYSSQPSPYQQAPSHGYSSRPSSQYAPSNPPPTPLDAYDRRGSSMAVPPSPSVYAPREADLMRRESDVRRDSLPSYRMPPLVDVNRPQPSLQLPPIHSMTAPPPPPPHLSRNDVIEAAPIGLPPPPEVVRAGSKRGYTDTFTENTRSLYDGQRPQDPHHSSQMYNARAWSELAYKRADGSVGSKPSNNYRE